MSLQKAFATIIPYTTTSAASLVSSEIDVSTAFSVGLAITYQGTIQDGVAVQTLQSMPMLQIQAKFDVDVTSWVTTWAWQLSVPYLAAGTEQQTVPVGPGSISEIVANHPNGTAAAATPGWAYIGDQRVWVTGSSTSAGAPGTTNYHYAFTPPVTLTVSGQPIMDGSQVRRIFLLDTVTMKAMRLLITNITSPPVSEYRQLLPFGFGATALLLNNVY
jgi:hypothetical protein